MNALAMPISSRTAADMLSGCFWANSPRILDERSATCWQTLASSAVSFRLAGCIAHEAIRARGPLCVAGIVKIVQVGYRLAHREERLMRIERPAKQHRQQLAGAALALSELAFQLGKSIVVVRLELRHALVRTVKGVAVRRQDQYILRRLAVVRYGVEGEGQRIAVGAGGTPPLV